MIWSNWLLVALAFAALAPVEAPASGYFGPPVYLGEEGRLAQATPEFYWDLEMKRLAKEFTPPEKRVISPAVKREPRPDGAEGGWINEYALFTTKQDLADYADALRKGAVKAANPAEAARMHAAARAAVDATTRNHTAPLPPELPSEFADYHRGAQAYRDGMFKEAAAAWEALLKRPKEERHYRSVWAAYMLGKLTTWRGGEDLQDTAVSNEWFRQTRLLAREGFADPLGLAADSYSWEAWGELELGHRHRAAELYLALLATGDDGAVGGLRQVVDAKQVDDLRAAAADPLLRKLTSMYQLAFGRTEEGKAGNRQWVAILQELDIKEADGADYLGWVAYQAGDYELAARWLRLAKSDTPAALCLHAKLLRRAGKTTEAAQAMLRAWKTLQKTDLDRRWDYPVDTAAYGERVQYDPAYFSLYESEYGPETLAAQRVAGDYGAFRLARGEFVPALDAFRKAGLWFDAAYVAEEVLTANELIKYVNAQPPEPPLPATAPNDFQEVRFHSLRYLLGRRLVREGRCAEARKYLPAPYGEVARRYAQALRDAENPQRSKAERAHAFFRAGWLARYAGMELMGTEGEPDNFATRGDFPAETLAAQRLARRDRAANDEEEIGGAAGAFRQMAMQPTDAEVKRLQKTRLEPALRFHYRSKGLNLMLKAVPLLPENSDELADVLNRAGRIARNLNPDLAERLYQQLERRCAKTQLGQTAAAQGHWFVAGVGRWSLEEEAALDALVGKPEDH